MVRQRGRLRPPTSCLPSVAAVIDHRRIPHSIPRHGQAALLIPKRPHQQTLVLLGETRQETLAGKQRLLLLVLLPIIKIYMVHKPTSAVCQIYKRTRQRASIWGAAVLQPKIPEHT